MSESPLEAVKQPPNAALKVGIIGAGIAGLAAAIALRRAGHDVELFERSSFKSELGAAIFIPVNASRILDKWGFDAKKAGGVELLQLVWENGKNLELMSRDIVGSMEVQYGHKIWSFHRIDLHNSLMQLATRHGVSEGSPASIRLASEVIGVDYDEGELTFVDNERIRKDLLVIADGAHSRFIEEVAGVAAPLSKLGRSAFRCLIPFDRILADNDTRGLFEGEDPGLISFVDPGNNIYCVTYPCRDAKILNVVVIHDTRSSQEDSLDWNSPATLDEVLECTKDFHPSIRALLAMTDEVKIFNLMHRPPLRRVTKGKAVLTGDAFHNMLPTHAQGSAMAMEDAAVLGVLFENVDSPAIVEDRLKLFDEVRIPRAVMTQLASNAGHGRHSEVESEVRKYYSGPFPPPGAKPYAKPWRDLFFNYDIVEETKKAMSN